METPDCKKRLGWDNNAKNTHLGINLITKSSYLNRHWNTPLQYRYYDIQRHADTLRYTNKQTKERISFRETLVAGNSTLFP